jgi:hypothetical protein
VVLILTGLHPFDSETAESVSPVQTGRFLPGEEFIRTHMINDDGTLKTNLQPHEAVDPNIAQGEETLSESIGLWMMYAVEKGDKPLFEQNVDVLRKHFMKEGLIYWKLGPKPVSTNALIDDLRIAEALYKAHSLWGSAQYRDLANQIAQSLTKRQIVDGVFTDFYDDQSEWTSQTLTLSYLKTAAFAQMYQNGALDSSIYEGTVQFLRELPMRNGFFPFQYDVQNKTYTYHQQVNIIDQLYIVYHRAQAQTTSPELWSFLKAEFEKRGFLYGRYTADTKQPAVDYESPAVYGLAILAAVELDDEEFAKDLYYRMIRHQMLNPESKYYGGYTYDDDTHIFDNLIPLVAERMMFNRGLLR